MKLFHDVMVKLGRHRLIPDRYADADYMHRYYLFLKDRHRFPFNVTLHKIVRSDLAIMHDHPWAYLTIILKGGYWEHLPKWNEDKSAFEDIRTWKGPGSVIKRSANEYHWLELEHDQPATTLFFMGPQQREWGFLVDKIKGKPKWIDNYTYLRDWKNYHNKHVEPTAVKKG